MLNRQHEKCATCEKTKPLFCFYGKINEKWLCNECAIALQNSKKKKTTHAYYYFDLVLETVNECIKKKVNIITTRTIRMLNHIKSSDRYKIQYIWRNLDFLEKNGFIELYKKNPKRYKLPQKEIKIEEVIFK